MAFLLKKKTFKQEISLNFIVHHVTIHFFKDCFNSFKESYSYEIIRIITLTASYFVRILKQGKSSIMDVLESHTSKDDAFIEMAQVLNHKRSRRTAPDNFKQLPLLNAIQADIFKGRILI